MHTSTKSSRPHFAVRTLPGGAYAIDDHSKTVATITQHGYVDWLLRSPLQAGDFVKQLHKDTHLSYIRGFKFNLTCPDTCTPVQQMGTDPESFEHQILKKGEELIITCRGQSFDGSFESLTTAKLTVTHDGSRYEWHLTTALRNMSEKPQMIVELEYNNVCPSLAYRGILHGRKKEFDCTLFQDTEGVIWEFPHQHSMHYGGKIKPLVFGTQSWAGFFGSENNCPIVEVLHSDLPLNWGICDMYYDLHCTAKTPVTFAPQQQVTIEYMLRYLSPAEAKSRLQHTRKIDISEEDQKAHDYPRFDFGLNTFSRPVHIDLPDEACCFRPSPPQKVWDRETGSTGKGSLRLLSEGDTIIWSTEPPVHVINGTTLRIQAKVRTKEVTGSGFYFRFRHYNYCWEPKPGFTPIQTIHSEPVIGTTEDWVMVSIPELRIPHGPVEDGLFRLDLVLEGAGTAWATDIEIEMEESLLSADKEEEDFTPTEISI